MAVRAFVPATFALTMALGSMWIIASWQSSPYLEGFVPTARWIPVAAFAFAVVHGAWASYRLGKRSGVRDCCASAAVCWVPSTTGAMAPTGVALPARVTWHADTTSRTVWRPLWVDIGRSLTLPGVLPLSESVPSPRFSDCDPTASKPLWRPNYASMQ